MPKKVIMVRPNGTTFEATPDQAEKLKVLGYHEQTVEELVDSAEAAGEARYYRSGEQKVLTAAEGWTAGALPGLGDAINPDPEGARARAAANPGIRLGSELTAGVAGALITGGESTLARGLAGGGAGLAAAAGNKTAQILGGELGARIVGLGAEGALLGAGSAVSDAVLSGDPLTASSVLSHVGPSTFIAMGTGAAAEGLIGLGRLGSRLDNVEESIATRAAGDTEDTLSQFYRSLPAEKKGRVDSVPEWLKKDVREADAGLVERYTQDVERVSQVSPYRPESYEGFRGAVGDYVRTTDTALGNLDDGLKASRKAAQDYTKSLEKSAADLRAAVGSVRREAADTASSQAERRAIESEFVSLEDGYKELQRALKETNDPVKALNRIERYKKAIKENPWFAGPTGAALPGLPDPAIAVHTRDALRAADNAFQMASARAVLKDFPATQEAFIKMRPERAEKMFAALDHAKVDDAFLTQMAADAGLELSGTPGQKARALWEAGKDIKKFNATAGRVERASFELPKDIPSAPASKRYEGDFEKLIAREPTKPQWPEIVSGPEASTETGVIRSTRKHQNTASLWHRIARLSASRQASAAAKRAGLGIAGSAVAYELGGAATASLFGGSFIAGIAGVKGMVLSRLRNAVAKYAPAAGRGLRKLAPRIEPLAVRLDGSLDERKDRRALFNERSKELLAAGPSMRDRAFMAVEPLLGEHPEFAAALHQTFVDSFNALMQFLPRDPGYAFNRLESLWHPTDVQMSQFAKAYAVFHDGLGTIEAILESGQVDATTVAALKTIHPPLYQELRIEMMNRLSEPGFLKSLSMGDQYRLDILLDLNLFSGTTPRSIAATQAMYQQQRQQGPSAGGSGTSNSGGRPAKTEPPTAGQSLIGPGGM